MRVQMLRAWYYFRELLGRPRRLDKDAFDAASPTVLLAGSPWIWTSSTSAATVTFAVTNTTWPRRQQPPPTTDPDA